MTPEKLESLRRLAADERTPEEEARTAAFLYVRNLPPIVVAAAEDSAAKAKVEMLERQVNLLTTEFRQANEALAKAKQISESATAIVQRLKDVQKAEEIAKQGRAEIDRQIREFNPNVPKKPQNGWGVPGASSGPTYSNHEPGHWTPKWR